MKIIEAINTIDALKPNNYTQSEKVRWLSDLDGIIKAEIINTHEEGSYISYSKYGDETDIENTELLVPSPHEDIYIKWLEAKIDYANAEYGKYNNSSAAYNTAYASFERHYNRLHKPIQKKLKFF